MGSFIEFWNLARRRPLTAFSLTLAVAALSIGGYVAGPRLERRIDPPNFANLSGEYNGTTVDGGHLRLCFVAFGPKVLGEMTLEGSTDHVDYWGEMDEDKNQLALHYTRGGSAADPDHGDAFLSQVGKNDLRGYYQSSVHPQTHQTLSLERTGQTCELQRFEQGW